MLHVHVHDTETGLTKVLLLDRAEQLVDWVASQPVTPADPPNFHFHSTIPQPPAPEDDSWYYKLQLHPR